MKVAFVTPMEERSAIAEVSLRVIQAVRHRWDIDIWYPACDRPRYTAVPTSPFVHGKKVARELASYDLVVFVLGNSPYHVEILAAARLVSGLVVMHDLSLIHLLAAYDDEHQVDLLESVARLCGPPAAAIALDDYRLKPGGSLTDLAGLLPMTQVAMQNSLGVITHSHYAAEAISGQTAGLIAVAPLPNLQPLAGKGADDAGHEMLLVVAGVVNSNKCIDRLIEAVAASKKLRDHARIRVVGSVSVEQRDYLAEVAAKAGLADRVELTGSLPLDEYDKALDDATVFVCLRDPVLEAASASLLDEMVRGRPVIVYNHGHYAELPDDAVIKVDPSGGQRALIQSLERLVSDLALGSDTGERGRDYVKSVHTAEAYARVLVDAGEAAMTAKAFIAGIRLLGRGLNRLGLDSDAYARVSAAAAFSALFVFDHWPHEEG
jgi:glycosyltransferase involved in cell wall biosynthesis